jgi:NAD+ kinase
LLGRTGSHAVVESLKTVLNFLQRRDCNIFIEEETASSFFSSAAAAHKVKVVKKMALADECDLVIVVGGDGSMLGAARVLCKANIAVLGINRGSLGFLTDISPDEIETRVSEVLDGKYVREERFLLDVSVSRKDKEISYADALNEVVVHRGTSLRMIEFALYIDGQFVYSQHSDGLIVSTPTGSTAYSLSGGGPILHPSLDAIALVPMFSHALTSRPIVVDGQSKIKLVMGNFRGGQPEVSCDGQNHLSIEAGDVIHIHKKNQTLTLIHPVNYNYYETCRTKLDWGSRLS